MADHKLPRKEVAPRPDQTELRVGRLTKAHGLKGAIKLELFTDEPGKRFVPGAVFTLQVPTASKWHGKTLTLRELRWYNGHPVGFFDGVDDRTEAETLVKAILWVNQDVRELPDEEDAWYDHQLVGLSAHRDGVVVGAIARVDHLPGQDLLAIKTPGGEVLVPFVTAIVPDVDLVAGTVTLTPPRGLFEDLPDDAPAADESAPVPAEETPGAE
ncbi:16S rRNA-processing protein RimM [Leifsonia xyli subsp. cynodontis DSM 46306]|uniref:Ribosome maturation factor RimM n=1 Tax=Leifsonia xyli subsp. cynodontis DSM 46306 TaxID=1389489 RepID=U3P491_LEIXC|nr:ribosome maturation factor RimM [Leifsonia xyli]AGW41140.1 16S rRNA-processing protein RimM [Leifsonia xyli subsp. cynodontis DSM 46306]